MIGRRVRAVQDGSIGTVAEWEPLGAALCDTLVVCDDRSRFWCSSHDLIPVDGLGPLPDRDDARRTADARTLSSLTVFRARLVEDVRRGATWLGCNHGKAILGRAVDGAIEDVRGRLGDPRR